MYRNYAFTIPGALFDSARVDGASDFILFSKIFLPISRPAMIVIFIFQFIWTWNDLLFGLVLAESTRPVMTALSKLTGLPYGDASDGDIGGCAHGSPPGDDYFVRSAALLRPGFTISLEK